MRRTVVRLGTPLGIIVGVALIAWQALAVSASAATPPLGRSPSDAILIAGNGHFAGVVWPSSSTWFQFGYAGGNQQAAVVVSFLPLDATRTDVGMYTGSPDNLVQENAASERFFSTLYRTFKARDSRDVFIRVMNDYPDRAISFVGTITPGGTMQGPPAALLPLPGAVADTPDVAIEASASGNGVFLGAVAPHQVIWHRFYYGTPDTTVTVVGEFVPSTGNARLDLSTGPDVGHLTQQTEAPTWTNNLVIVRQVTLPTPQWVYFSVSNGGKNAAVAYAGMVTPASDPPASDP